MEYAYIFENAVKIFHCFMFIIYPGYLYLLEFCTSWPTSTLAFSTFKRKFDSARLKNIARPIYK